MAVRSDVDVRQDVLEALRKDTRIDARTVHVDVVGGVVYLAGAVPTHYQKRVAAEIVHQIKGVVDVVNAIWATRVVDEPRIYVRTVNGTVYLSGTVGSSRGRHFAELDAWMIPGVVDVVNDIVVEAVPTRTDSEIADDVRDALTCDPRVDADKFAVETQDGVVHLRGSVPNISQKREAEDLDWSTKGVRYVANELNVTP